MAEYTVVASRGANAAGRVRGRYQDGVAPRLAIDYDLAISTDEPDGRFAWFHESLRRRESMKLLGAAGAPLTGCLRRRPSQGRAPSLHAESVRSVFRMGRRTHMRRNS